MKKKIAKILCLLLLAVICTAAFSACDDPVEPVHEHDWGDWKIVKSATCTEAGTETRTCKTDTSHTETQTIPALGHDGGQWYTVSQSTCTAAGTKELR
ncbi:MAG: hypothetical protein FWE84_06550, partial [Firmicutes bacterium]|nr:hypothetical protein [Bacillota bacterium]